MSRAGHAFQLLARVGQSPERSMPAFECGPGELNFLSSRGIDSLYYISQESDARRQLVYDEIWRIQRLNLVEALDRLQAAGLRPILLKGAELCERYFSPRALGVMGDLDILLPRTELEEARAVFYDLGFRHARYSVEAGELVSRDIAELGQIELQHYELAPLAKLVPLGCGEHFLEAAAEKPNGPIFRRGNEAVLALEFDVHHSVAADVDPSPLIARAVPSVFPKALTLSLDDHLWVNLTRHYVEVAIHGSCSLRAIAYTAPLIREHGPDWSPLVEIAEDMRLGCSLYYFLALADELSPGQIPPSVLERIRASDPDRRRDWGWQLGKLFGFEEAFPSGEFVDAMGPEPSPPFAIAGV